MGFRVQEFQSSGVKGFIVVTLFLSSVDEAFGPDLNLAEPTLGKKRAINSVVDEIKRTLQKTEFFGRLRSYIEA